MTILTDAVIEKAARAYWRAMNKGPGATHSTCLRAALKAVLPELIVPLEKCQRALAMLVDPANIAVTTPIQAFATAHEAEVTARNAIAAIRSLSSEEKTS